MEKIINISNDIREAKTLPGWFYHDRQVFDQSKESVFAQGWQMITGAENMLRLPYDALPFHYMDGFLPEPLLALNDGQNNLHCLSNVCTHRGKILVEHPGKLDRGLVCGYHGRRFHLDGQFMSMPQTDGMLNFPCPADNLHRLPVHRWHQFVFTSLHPTIAFDEWIGDMERKTAFLRIEDFRYSAAHSRDYLVKANWALYCDNYLEGFHIPFVHKGLAGGLDLHAYRTELYPWSSCQVGVSKGGEQVFDLPNGHEDYGQEISAYYFWLFPNYMFNFYPWGLSLNIVRPLDVNLTKISFRTYIWDEGKMGEGAGADVDLVEREDEAVVEQVQIGTSSRFYQYGRYSPKMETGVHHFHQLLTRKK